MVKTKIAVTIDPELLDWIDAQVLEKVYSSRSHAIERSIFQAKKVSNGIGEA